MAKSVVKEVSIGGEDYERKYNYFCPPRRFEVFERHRSVEDLNTTFRHLVLIAPGDIYMRVRRASVGSPT